MALLESILDFPHETLNPSLWNKLEDGSYELRDDAKKTIQQIVDWAKETFKMPNVNVNLTGSNTSNSYSKDSDIDIHFNSPNLKKDKVDQFNKLLRKKFEELVQQKPELGEVNGVKAELYMQPNPFQDLMSVGCYDFLGNKWIVGPELKDQGFDPYAEYFNKSMKSIDDVIDGIRSLILQMYELSLATLKAKDMNFKKHVGDKLLSTMRKAAKLFKALKERRSVESQPTDAKSAEISRNSAEWKTSDSAFKLLDKFGYLKLLQCAAKSTEDNADPEEAAQQFISLVTDKLSSKSLDDSEKTFIGKLLEMESCNESMSSMMKLSTIALMMSIGSLLPAQALAKELSNAKEAAVSQHQKFNKDSSLVKDAVSNASTSNVMIGDLSKVNVANALAKVLWLEGRGESEEGIKAIASVIRNRAGGEVKYLIPVVKEHKQFSCLNGYTGGWKDKTYKWYNPDVVEVSTKNGAAKWKLCKDIAQQLVDGTFKSTIGDFNMYLNKDTADAKAVQTWGKKCSRKIGKHWFGHSTEHDPKYVVPGTNTTWKVQKMQKRPVDNRQNGTRYVTVQKGDALSDIAKWQNTSTKKLMALNPSLKSPSKISVGQKIRVK